MWRTIRKSPLFWGYYVELPLLWTYSSRSPYVY
nr:MAG TPA: hypothetical protein [Bacteriophage sp.]